jgi:hypothetical protein
MIEQDPVTKRIIVSLKVGGIAIEKWRTCIYEMTKSGIERIDISETNKESIYGSKWPNEESERFEVAKKLMMETIEERQKQEPKGKHYMLNGEQMSATINPPF